MGKLRLLVCGDRRWTDGFLIKQILAEMKDRIEVVIEGECRGVDLLARKAAWELGLTVLPFPADWATYGPRAGPIRNKQMLDEGRPNQVLAFHDSIETSKGTKNMIQQARSRGLPIKVISHEDI